MWKFPVTGHDWNIGRAVVIAVFPAAVLFSFFYAGSVPFFASFTSVIGARLSPPPSLFQNDSTLSVQSDNVRPFGHRDPRVAICLVGGARRFELTGPALLDRVVNVFGNSDLFLHSPLDENSYKLSLLKGARRIAAVRISRQVDMPETTERKEVLTPSGSPNGLQGLLHYFNLVEGCLSMIDEYQSKNRIQYDWIVRTRVDTYWSAPLTSEFFEHGTYVVPSGSAFGGLNDRFGVGDLNTSRPALSRLSLIPQLFAAGYRNLNSESAFKAQLETQMVRFRETRVPFCVISDRHYPYPFNGNGVPVASITSHGPLSGAKCRPCPPACDSRCSSAIFRNMDRRWSWIDGDPDLCDGHGDWEEGWEAIFDQVAGEKYAEMRKRIRSLDLDQCTTDFDSMRSRADTWDVPSSSDICKLGLRKNTGTLESKTA